MTTQPEHYTVEVAMYVLEQAGFERYARKLQPAHVTRAFELRARNGRAATDALTYYLVDAINEPV